MDERNLLKPKLLRLKLSGILESIDQRMDEAMCEKWDYTHFLLALLSDEVERRDNKQLSRRIARSGLDPQKTLATFDFSFNPGLHEPTVKQLASCAFLEAKKNLFLLGPSGVGKSHLGQAIGNEAVLRGHDVLYRNTYALFKWLSAGIADGSHERRIQQVRTVDLLILDDFGMRDLSDNQQADLYELIAERYERRSTLITSNRDFDEWPMIFTNPLMGSAAMDRLVHRATKIAIDGKSYRLESFLKTSRALTKTTKNTT